MSSEGFSPPRLRRWRVRVARKRPLPHSPRVPPSCRWLSGFLRMSHNAPPDSCARSVKGTTSAAHAGFRSPRGHPVSGWPHRLTIWALHAIVSSLFNVLSICRAMSGRTWNHTTWRYSRRSIVGNHSAELANRSSLKMLSHVDLGQGRAPERRLYTT